MSFDVVRQSVESEIKGNWLATPVEYENTELDKSNLNEYISVNIIDNSAKQATLGENGSYIIVGVVVVSIFTPNGIGSSRSRVLADGISNIFRAKKIGGLTFKVPKGYRVRSDSSYYQYNVAIPFYAFFNL
jgi:hypothetical protein